MSQFSISNTQTKPLPRKKRASGQENSEQLHEELKAEGTSKTHSKDQYTSGMAQTEPSPRRQASLKISNTVTTTQKHTQPAPKQQKIAQ